jgi:hypothetical protein
MSTDPPQRLITTSQQKSIRSNTAYDNSGRGRGGVSPWQPAAVHDTANHSTEVRTRTKRQLVPEVAIVKSKSSEEEIDVNPVTDLQNDGLIGRSEPRQIVGSRKKSDMTATELAMGRSTVGKQSQETSEQSCQKEKKHYRFPLN